MKNDEFVLIVAVVPVSEREQVNLSDNAYHTSQTVTRKELIEDFEPMVKNIMEAMSAEVFGRLLREPPAF